MGSKERFYFDIMNLHPEVTGSCHLVVVKFPNGESLKFVVDCGLFQEIEYQDYNRELLFKPEEISFCLVTHNHVDHIGRLPFMIRYGFRGNIYTTFPTSRLMPLALADSYKVLRDVSKRKNKKMLYDESDIFKTEALITPIDYYVPTEVNSNVTITFLKNGHLVGAAMILVQIKYPEMDNINLLFTGDYNNKNMFFDVPEIPKWIRELPITIIQESTYGDMDSTSMTKCFKNNLLQCMDNNGTAIIPVFSLGRAQEMLYEIKCMQDCGELDKNIPIYLDGQLAIRYTGLYLNDKLMDIKEEMLNFLPHNLSYVDKTIRQEIIEKDDNKIVLTTSGMGTYGPAQLYIIAYLNNPKALIHFTGYTAEDTLGGRLKNAKKGEDVEIGGLFVKKEALVEYTTEYSAHAKADEMIETLKGFDNIKLILLNHGETDVKIIFAKRIVDNVNAKNVGILGRDYFYRINPYGLAKILTTKFN